MSLKCWYVLCELACGTNLCVHFSDKRAHAAAGLGVARYNGAPPHTIWPRVQFETPIRKLMFPQTSCKYYETAVGYMAF